MLLNYQRRFLLHLCRQTISLSKRLPWAESPRYEQIRQINHTKANKRKILMKINTTLKETDSLESGEQHADAETFTCLNNELILSERMIKFPFHYRCVLEQQWGICSDRSVSKDEWDELYRVTGESTKPVFASVTMLICVQLKHVERGRSLFHYIEQNHPELLKTTPTTYAAYMHLLATDFFTVPAKKHGEDYSPNEGELLRVYETYAKTREQTTLTSAAALGFIKGLCATRRWHEAYSFLLHVNDDNQLPAATDLILAALHNDDLPMANKFLVNLKVLPTNDSAAATMSSTLNDMVRDLFRNLNEKNPLAYEFIQNLFHYLSQLNSFIEQSAVQEMQTFFAKCPSNTFKWGSTVVYPNGVCKQLPGISLQTGELNEEEFQCLRDYLIKKAYAKDEVYNTTNPREFEAFKTFLTQHRFTMIVDGLNILYGIDRFATDPVASMVKTINFLKNLRVSRSQMLFIARKHALSRIPPDVQNDLRSICEIFLVDNTSRDDWFVLHAALQSKAYVLTSDILRKERGIANKATPAIDPQINELLQKWLYRYQYMFIRQGGRVYFKQPMAYKLKAQCVRRIWLVPYFSQKPGSLAQRPDQWFFVYQTADHDQSTSSSPEKKPAFVPKPRNTPLKK